MCNHEPPEPAMVVVCRAVDGHPTVWCDPCLVPLVRALNDGGLPTVASCCGHGRIPGVVALADGRQLTITQPPVRLRTVREVIDQQHELAAIFENYEPAEPPGSTMTDTELRSWARRINPDKPDHGRHKFHYLCPWCRDGAHEAALGLFDRIDKYEAVANAAANVAERLACNHYFDPECARCEWLRPFREAISALGASE